ncbi:hypothetical protein AB1Y20_023624 [Prymnesium parvum]|uniref:Uncharacterized protein n=1 Tax=Prymnesium parvum TaxID=97485 RepID=A0AB34JE83_PRYPA
MARFSLASRAARRLACTSSFYDSQSGRHVVVPTTLQCHLSLAALASDRVGSACRHLISPEGKPVRGLASVAHAIAADADGAAAAIAAGHDVYLDVRDVPQGLAAVRALVEGGRAARAILSPRLCEEAADAQLAAAELADAGAQVLFLPAGAGASEDALRESVESVVEVDVEGAPMGARVGLCVAPGTHAAPLMAFAHRELGVLHFMSCLAGTRAPRPSEVLAALGVAKSDAAYSSLFLAEHVPDAA